MAREGEKRLLTVAMMHGKGRRRGDLLRHAEHAARDPAVRAPRWLDAAHSVPPLGRTFAARRPAKIVYPEDRLMRAYYERNPEARFVPIDMESGQVHFVRAFALRQLELMQTRGLTERQARAAVEAEAEAERRARQRPSEAGGELPPATLSAPPPPRNLVQAVQEEEEEELFKARIRVMEQRFSSQAAATRDQPQS